MNTKMNTKFYILITLSLSLSLSPLINGLPFLGTLFDSSCDDLIYVRSNSLIIGHNIEKIKNITKSENVSNIRNYDDNTDINDNDTNYEKNKNNNKTHNNNINNNNTNIKYNGIVKIKYKTLSHCIYECDFIAITNRNKYEYVNYYLKNKYTIGWVINGVCSKKGCVYENGICNTILERDEL